MHITGLSYKHSLLFLGLLFSNLLVAQVTIVVHGIPKNTPENDQLYISGNFEGWTGGQEAYRLTPKEDAYKIDIPAATGSIEFKFTRGSWDSVELDANGNQLDNRSYSFSGKSDTLRFDIAHWADLSPKKSTASSNVHLLDDSFDMFPLEKKRQVWIYLPKNYQNAEKRYPVLYMHDGQNLFDQSSSYSGEWEVDETLDRLQASGTLEIIVVGIDHGGGERMDEYAPWEFTSYPTKKQGDAYVQFIQKNLKPYVDNNFRTLSDRDHTGIMGSSLGGLISFYAALKYPETFGIAGVFSPSFEMSTPSLNFAGEQGNTQHVRMYLMAGDNESGQMVEKMNQVVELMKGAGFPEDNISSKVVQKGEHNEKLWREQFEQAVLWLFKDNI